MAPGLSVMGSITSILVMVSLNQVTQSKPLHYEFFLKLKPYSMKEEVRPKTFSSLFTKASKDLDLELLRDLASKEYYSHVADSEAGCSNNIAKILFPVMGSNENNSQLSYINIPIVQQPFKDYKIVVATAPSNIKIAGPGAEPVVVYIVFPEEEPSDSTIMNIPTLYFVTKSNMLQKSKRRENVEPIIIIDSNRTVTGLKSKEVPKYVQFKRQLSRIMNDS